MRRHSVDDDVGDVAAVAATLASPPVVVGHSMGGFVTQRHLPRGGRASGGVLLASVPPRGVLPLLGRRRDAARPHVGRVLGDRAVVSVGRGTMS